jgi:hypothetical protein
MDDFPALGRDDHRNQLLAQFGPPAYLRRARAVRDALEQLLQACRRKREEYLEMVRVRLGQLKALAGGWEALGPLLRDDEQLDVLRRLHEELAPALRVPVAATASRRAHRRALLELRESLERFNRRWREYLGKVDRRHVNELRDGYNRYYVLEKECLLRSPRLAREGFERLGPLTADELAALLPPLPVPALKD